MPDTVIALDITRALELHVLLEYGVDSTPKSTPLRFSKITDDTIFDRAGCERQGYYYDLKATGLVTRHEAYRYS